MGGNGKEAAFFQFVREVYQDCMSSCVSGTATECTRLSVFCVLGNRKKMGAMDYVQLKK